VNFDLRTFNCGFINCWRALISFIQIIWFIAIWNLRKYRIKNLISLISCFRNSYFSFFLKINKRNIYLFGRQLVIGDLGHVKDMDGNLSSSRSRPIIFNQAFGTANYLAPEAHDLRRSNKIDIWSFGCIVYELFNLEKLFDNRHPDRLRDSIRTFQVETKLKTNKIRPLYVRVIKK
jgi:serine/threonine protein kinase